MTSPSAPTSRVVRVFISSTFRDFGEERDLLMKRVFPELRRRARDRFVEVIGVDLRWGITEEESQQGETLPICLREIERSRPYFIGLLGERYGWTPAAGQYPENLLAQQPWLAEHAGGKSVTELEILHGVLNAPEMAGRAYFYFRDAAWSEGKDADFRSEGADERAKLARLKERVRSSPFPVVDYPTPEAVAERITEDLWRLIDAEYPPDAVPDELERERRSHEAYALERRRLYVGQEETVAELLSRLEQASDEKGEEAARSRITLVTGESGTGKSALIANVLAKYRERHPSHVVIEHYVGSTSDASDPTKLMRRIAGEIQRLTGSSVKIPTDFDEWTEQFDMWLTEASFWAERHGVQLVLAVDALEKLDSSTRARWIPKTIPAQVRVVVSSLPCEDFAALERRNPGMIAARPFTREVARTYLIETLARRSRRLPTSEVERIVAHPRAVLPIFMKTLVEELSVFGSHEGLAPRITECLAAQEPDDLFEVILARLEQELGVDVVRKPLEALGVVYWGLSEDELLDFTGVQPLRWSQLRLALDDALIETRGVVRLSHAYMQKCVADRYLPQEADRHARRRDFGLWSEAREPSPRSAWGMSFGFIVPCAAADLEKCLLNPRTGLALLEYRPRDEVMWHYIQAAKFHGEVNAGRWMARAIEPRWDAWRAAIAGRPDHGGSAWSGLLNLLLRLRSTGDFSMQITDEAITWAESRFEAVSPSDGPNREARVLVLLHRLAGDVCRLNSEHAKARGHYERAVTVARSIASARPTDESRMVVALALEELASCLDSTEEWHATIRAALAEHRSVVTKDHLQTSMSQQARLLALLARHEAYADRNDEAAALAAESIRLARKCVEEFGDPFSLIGLAKSLHTVAGLEFVRGRSDKAQQLLDEGIKATERALSASWSSAGLVNLAGLQRTASMIEGARGNKDASRRLSEEALSIVRRLASYTEAEEAQHQLISALRDAGQRHRERREYKEAAAVHGEMVEAYRRVIRIADSDEHRSGLAWGLLAYGMDQWWAGDLRGAAASLSEASELADAVGRGAESRVDYQLKSYAAGCLAQLHERRGRIDAALRAFDEALHAARAWGIDAKQAQLGSLEAGALRMRIAVEKRDRKAIVGATSCVIAVVVLAAVVAGVHDGWKGATIVSLIGISPLAILPQFGLIELVGLLVLCLGAVGARYGVAPALISALPAAVWLLWMWRSKRSPAPA